MGRKTPQTRNLILAALLGLCLAALASVSAADPVLRSVNYKEADIRDVLNALAAQAGVSISMDDSVTGIVSFHFEDVTFEECLSRLAAMFRLFVSKQDRHYTITRQSIKIAKGQDGTIDVDIQEAKLAPVLAELTKVTGVNCVLMPPAPNDRVNLVLERVTLDGLIDYLAESARCEVERKDGAYVFRQVEAKGRMIIRYEQGKLSADVAGAALGAVVREISTKTGQSVLCDQAIAGLQITVFFPALPLEDALNALAAANGLRVLKDGEHYRLSRGDNLAGSTIRYRNGLLTIDVRNVEITEILAEISRQAKVTIIPNRDVTGRVSGTITEIEWEPGLASFLQANGFVMERQGQVLTIKRQSTGQNVIISVNPDGTLDLDVSNANLAAAATELARRKGFGVVIYANVNWNVTSVHLRGVEFEEALERLMAGTTYTYRREGDTYLIGEGVNFRQGDTDFINSEIIPLRHVQAEVVWNTLPSAFPRQNIVLLKDSNALLATGSPKLIAALKTYLAKVDVVQENVRTEIVPLRHMKAEDALKLLPPSIPKNELVVIKETNSIAVTGNEGYRALIRGYLEKVDVMAPMILFDVLVLQVSQNSSRGGGLDSLVFEEDGQKIEWNLGSLVGTIISPLDPAAAKLNAVIKTAISDGRAKVRANPKIATLSGTPAHFDVVTKYNYTWPMSVPTTDAEGKPTTKTEYRNFSVDSGIMLTLTPWVSADKEITLELKPKISQHTTSPTEGVGTDVKALPGVMERSTQSTVRIMDGYTVIISGFVQESEEVTESKVPILGSIPILGELFKSKTKTKRQDEFVIIITPRLIEDPAQLNEFMGEVSGPGSTPEPIVIDLDEKKKPPKP